VLGSLATTIISIVITIGSHAFSIIVGIILSIYFLIYKESIIRRSKRLLCAIFKQKNYEKIMDFANYTNNTFARYIVGAILDSILVGIVIGLVLWACGFPFAALIGVICGVTNIILFFGPFIGSIPSAVLILISTGDIWKVILFALIILIIQQIDGNLIAPHIHGASTGLTPIGVIAAVTICSHLFGFIGMLIGVPLCAVFTYLFSKFLDSRLKKKNLPSDTKLYRSKNLYSNQEFINASIEVEAINLIEKNEEESSESSSNSEHSKAVNEMYDKILYNRAHPEQFPIVEIDEAASDEDSDDDYTEDV
jgi:predicted PurR-regulated permease PerM